MNRSATAERRRIRRNSIVRQLQEQNQVLRDTLGRIQIELNLNRQIIEELLAGNDEDSEDYSTSVESLELSSVEIIQSPEPERKLRAQATTTVIPTTAQKRNKKQERKESFEKARAWALDCAKDKERKKNEHCSKFYRDDKQCGAKGQ
jgi:hypothetical protein